MTHKEERGAAAVELALILPVILMLLFGIIQFGRAYNASIVVTHAAREAVRKVALGASDAEAKTAGEQAGLSLPGGVLVASIPPGDSCPANLLDQKAKTTVTYPFTFDIPFVPGLRLVTISKTATMLCGG
jgi:TadE-like protein